MKTRQLLPVLVLGVIAFLAVDMLQGSSLPCVEGQRLDATCTDETSLNQPYCQNGFSQNNVTECNDLDKCFVNKCIPKDGCDLKTCITAYSRLERDCSSGSPVDTVALCPTGTYCSMGVCKVGGGECGDKFCGPLENSRNCPGDCNALSSWESAQKSIVDGNLQAYTECNSQFNCNDPRVQAMAAKIMVDYNVQNPRQYIDAVSDYVHGYITYKANGGTSTCGQSASGIISEGEQSSYVYGNCVDYSTLMIALVRAKGLAIRQVAGCAASLDLQCLPFAVTADNMHYGYLNEQQSILHSYTQVWVDGQWLVSDPTTGTGVSRCLGYQDLVLGGPSDQQICQVAGNVPSSCISVVR